MPRGCDRDLDILAFDQCGSFQTNLFGWKGVHVAETGRTRRVILDGFMTPVAWAVPGAKAGNLVDELVRAAILRDAKPGGFATAGPAQHRGQEEFDLECCENFTRHIEAFGPTVCKLPVIAGHWRKYVDIFEKSRSVTEAA